MRNSPAYVASCQRLGPGSLRGWVAVLFLLLLVSTAPAQSTRDLTFSTLEAIESSQLGIAPLTRAYETLGMQFKVEFNNSKRSLILSSSGVTDGELVRIEGLETRYPSLIRIDVPIAYLNAAIFVRSDADPEMTPETLSTRQVGRMTGVVFSEKFTRDFDNVWVADSHEELFSLLAQGKLDAVVASVFAGERTTRNLSLDNIRTLGDAFRAEPLYHYLHEKNKELAPEIEAVLKEMKQRGELDDLM